MLNLRGPINDGSEGLSLLVIAYVIAVFILHVIMALAVNGDAKRLLANRKGMFLFGPFLWGWIVLFFGLAGLALYWAIHHSTLRANTPPPHAPHPPGDH